MKACLERAWFLPTSGRGLLGRRREHRLYSSRLPSQSSLLGHSPLPLLRTSISWDLFVISLTSLYRQKSRTALGIHSSLWEVPFYFLHIPEFTRDRNMGRKPGYPSSKQEVPRSDPTPFLPPPQERFAPHPHLVFGSWCLHTLTAANSQRC